MAKHALYPLLLIALAGCRICLEADYVFFDKEPQVLQTESESFFIQQVDIIQHSRAENRTNDTLATIRRVGAGKRRVDFKNVGDGYRLTGDLTGWINRRATCRVWIRRFKPFEKPEEAWMNEALITFTPVPNDRKREKYGAGHPCP